MDPIPFERILVTGGAGFIGANFVRLLLEESEAEIVVLDKLTYAGCRESLDEPLASGRVRLVVGDLADRDLVRSLFEEGRFDALVNFAAESHVDRSIDEPEVFVRTNALAVAVALDAARRQLEKDPNRRERFRFLQVSTDEVYGSLGAEGYFDEDSPYAPSSPYAASKAAGDHLARSWFSTFGVPVIVTHCSNNYGPFQHPEKLIPLMTLNALEGRDLPLYGDGLNVRDWIHVRDHCRGLLLALTRGAPGRTYDLGGRSERTNRQVVEAICAALERFVPAATNEALLKRGSGAYIDLLRRVEDRPGHDRRYAIDSTRAERELGFGPERAFEEGLAETVRWYLDNRAWCRAVEERGYSRERLGLGGRLQKEA